MIKLNFDSKTCADYFYYAHQIYSFLYENGKSTLNELDNKIKEIILDKVPIKVNDYIHIESSNKNEICYMKIDNIDIFSNQSEISLTLYGQLIVSNFENNTFSYDNSSYYETSFDMSDNEIELSEFTLINKDIFYDLLKQCESKIKILLV